MFSFSPIPKNAIPASFDRNELMERGYKPYQDTFESQKMGSWYLESWQKRFDDHRGKKYYINLNHYLIDFGDNKKHEQYRLSWNANVHFQREEDVFDVSIHVDQKSIEKIEALFEEMWWTLRFDYDEVFDGGSFAQIITAHDTLQRYQR